MSSVELYAAGSSIVLLVGVYVLLVPYFVRQKASRAPNAPSEPRVFALGCAVFAAMLPIMAAMQLWGAWRSPPQKAEPFQITLLGQKNGSDPQVPWSDKEKRRATLETVALVKYFDKALKDSNRTGDLKPIRDDEVISKTINAYILFRERGGDAGESRPCFMALLFYANIVLDLTTNRGEGLKGDEYNWMMENCSRCEKLLK